MQAQKKPHPKVRLVLLVFPVFLSFLSIVQYFIQVLALFFVEHLQALIIVKYEIMLVPVVPNVPFATFCVFLYRVGFFDSVPIPVVKLVGLGVFD